MTYENYQSIELDLEGILADLTAIISGSEAAEVRHFIGVGEYGLAFETLCGVIVDADYTIPRSVYQKVIDLAQRMNIDKTFWEVIKTA